MVRGLRLGSGWEGVRSPVSGVSRNKFMTCVIWARVMPPWRAISAWLLTLPDSSMACHSIALRRSSATRGFLGSRGGLELRRGGGMALTIRSAGVRRVTLATGLFLNTPFGSTVISTVCSR